MPDGSSPLYLLIEAILLIVVIAVNELHYAL
jgi:hypothetical protein